MLGCFLAKALAAVAPPTVADFAAAIVEKGLLDIPSGAMRGIQRMSLDGKPARRAPESAMVITCTAALAARKALATRRLVMPDKGKLQGRLL